MRATDDPRLGALLEAENAYTEAITAPLDPLRTALFEEIRGRVKETDLTVPWRKGDWWYQARTFEGRSYPVHVRFADDGSGRPPTGEAEAHPVLDENEVADGHEYSQVGGAAVSPDGTRLAWSVDHAGDEAYTLRIRDLATGEDLADEVPGISYALAWSADSAHVFYTTLDEIRRPWKVWKHAIGTDASEDALVYTEPDERFFVGVEANRSGDWIVVSSQSAVTSEHHLLDARRPDGDLRLVAARRQHVEYQVEAHRQRLFILSNADGAEDFMLCEADADDLDAPWSTVIAHEPGVRLEGVDAFADHLVVHVRRDGITGLRIIDLGDGTRRDVALPEAVGTVSPNANFAFDATTYRFSYQSLVTPPSVFEEDLGSGARTLLKQHEVLGGYDPTSLTTTRVRAESADGVTIPISLVHRADLPLDGAAPCMLYGYGAYEISMDPWFSAARLSLLDRGWVYAIAHVRGGGELGRRWYLDGKFEHKTNSFSDFVTCARHLVSAGYTAPGRVVARGGSAGGLLVGASLNLAPELFAAVIAEVPFVDPLSTLLDPTLPLTVTEWEEWGNPVDDPEAFAVIAGYSPYENVHAVPYPAVLATAGVTDPRVSVHEPIKWVQELRQITTGDRPILLKVEMGAGHGGPTGRYDAWRDEAFLLAFALDAVAATD
jgi:oligopeptidase B